MTRKTTGRNPRTLVVHVVIECPNVPTPESDRADWCLAEIADHLKHSGLTEQGFRWYVDDAHMKAPAAPRQEGSAR